MVKFYLTKNPSGTKKFGESFAEKIFKNGSQKRAIILGLIGELGGGKTTFLQGFARGLGIKQKILSSTFIIMKKFLISDSQPNTKAKLGAGPVPHRNEVSGAGFLNFYHIDCYRIEKPKEILDLGFKEIIFNPRNIVAIEWANKISKIMPKDIMILKFEFIDKNTRKIVVK